MPPSIFPIAQGGLILPVVIGLDGQEIVDLLAAGQPIPAPLEARGLVDTATDLTAVASAVLRSLGVPKLKTVTTKTAAGDVDVDVFSVSLSILGPAPGSGFVWTAPSLSVTELATTLPDTEVLLGPVR